jgi:hypothetical protein
MIYYILGVNYSYINFKKSIVCNSISNRRRVCCDSCITLFASLVKASNLVPIIKAVVAKTNQYISPWRRGNWVIASDYINISLSVCLREPLCWKAHYRIGGGEAPCSYMSSALANDLTTNKGKSVCLCACPAIRFRIAQRILIKLGRNILWEMACCMGYCVWKMRACANCSRLCALPYLEWA